MRSLVARLPLAVLALLTLALLPQATAEEEHPTLTRHPLADAKPGEFLVYQEKTDRWTSYFCERVLDVKDGKVLWELSKTDEEGKDHGPLQTKWRTVTELKPNRWQTVTKDKMVELEVDGKTLVCRYFEVEEPKDRAWPDGEKIRKEVWYSNDVPVSGKVKAEPGNRMVLKWGQMSEEETKKRLAAYEEREKRRKELEEKN